MRRKEVKMSTNEIVRVGIAGVVRLTADMKVKKKNI